MPKLKTKKAVRKRFRVTRNGKVIGSASLRRHMLTDRSSKHKRQNRRPQQLDKADRGNIKKMLPYG
ncbi:MAG: 50S ribosomal protein L35 [Candidatus Omnitrophica bacterium]|nr:50S ribosomal protein L35 [Candidatus Omnitrophota bacterium]